MPRRDDLGCPLDCGDSDQAVDIHSTRNPIDPMQKRRRLSMGIGLLAAVFLSGCVVVDGPRVFRSPRQIQDRIVVTAIVAAIGVAVVYSIARDQDDADTRTNAGERRLALPVMGTTW